MIRIWNVRLKRGGEREEQDWTCGSKRTVSEAGTDQTAAKGHRVWSCNSSDLFGFYLPLINWVKWARRRRKGVMKKENKEHLISPAGASVRDGSAEEKLYQLARLLQSPCWLREVWRCSKGHNLLFNPNSQIDSRTPLYWASASNEAHAQGRCL